MLDQLNSCNVTDAGPADLIADSPDDDDLELLGPGGMLPHLSVCANWGEKCFDTIGALRCPETKNTHTHTPIFPLHTVQH